VWVVACYTLDEMNTEKITQLIDSSKKETFRVSETLKVLNIITESLVPSALRWNQMLISR